MWLSNFLQSEVDVDIRDTFVLTIPGIAMCTFMLRVMQVSTESLSEMLVLEILGTCFELFTTDR